MLQSAPISNTAGLHSKPRCFFSQSYIYSPFTLPIGWKTNRLQQQMEDAQQDPAHLGPHVQVDGTVACLAPPLLPPISIEINLPL
jgi:hypothetical protein